MVKRNCQNCKKEFQVYLWYVKVGRAKYCSKQCSNIAKKGKHNSPSTEFKKGNKSYWQDKKRPEIKEWLNPFKKGQTPWNKGIKGYSTSWKGKVRPEILGDKNKAWKGDKVGYGALHDWIKDHFPRKYKCEKCQGTKNIQMANKSHLYKRDITDWMELCRPCHMKYDDVMKKAWITRRNRIRL
jgi:hypothetical protein